MISFEINFFIVCSNLNHVRYRDNDWPDRRASHVVPWLGDCWHLVVDSCTVVTVRRALVRCRSLSLRYIP